MKYDINVGFSRVDITPPLGVSMGGYFMTRYAEGIIDPLELNCVAVEKDGYMALIATIDNCEPYGGFEIPACRKIAETLDIPENAVFLHFTHSHTSPKLDGFEKPKSDIDTKYANELIEMLGEGARLAVADMCPAKMGIGEGRAENIAFNRRYLMKDGTTRTNPGINNPMVEKSIGPVDERVNLIRFVRESGDSILLINFGNHPDTIGGSMISADWPGLTRRIFERAVPDAKCVVINGAEGDLNHINPFPKPHELEGMKIDFDDVPRGYAHTVHMANALSAAALCVYGKMRYIDVDSVTYKALQMKIPTNMPTQEELINARKIHELHAAGKDDELPYDGMMLTTVIYEAERMLKLENGPEFYEMTVFGLKLGSVAFIAIPGEPFAGIGIGIKQSDGYEMICPMCLTNGAFGYFPMKDSYDEGGYEARSSIFKAGVGELIIKECKKLLADLSRT